MPWPSAQAPPSRTMWEAFRPLPLILLALVLLGPSVSFARRPALPTPGIPPGCGIPADLPQPDWPRTLGETSTVERLPPALGSITIALLPDTQYYSSCRYPHLKNQTDFLFHERGARNIQAAIALGDLTDHNLPAEWTFFKASLAPLGSGFPIFLTTGNHDLGPHGTANDRSSRFPQYFNQAWAKKTGELKEVLTPGAIDNAFYSVNTGHFKLGVLMLEWSPRQRTVDWANGVLAKYPDHRVMVATHAYLYNDGTRYDYATKSASQKWNPLEYNTAKGKLKADGNHDGELLWNALIRKHANVFLVVSGHVLANGTGFLESRGDAGNSVHQALANFQMLDEGGLGYLRLLEISPDGKTLHMKTYSPSLKLYSYANDQDFSFVVEPPLFQPASAASAPAAQPVTRVRPQTPVHTNLNHR